MLLEVFASVLLPILVVVGAGYLFRRRAEIDVRPMSRISLYLLSPALIFSSLVEANIAQGETVRVVSFMVLLVVAMGLLSRAVSVALRLSRESSTAMMLCTMFSNAGNYGLPVAYFAFGDEGFERAILFFVMQGILVQVLGLYLASSGHSDWRTGLLRLVTLPQIYAVVAALAVRWAGPELVLESSGLLNNLYQGVSLMGEAAIPVLLVILGVQLAETTIDAADRLQISLAVFIRLLAAVPISFALAYALGMDPLSIKLAVILGSMPTAVNVTILAVEFDIRPQLVSSVVIISTLLSFVTLTVLLTFFGAGG